VSVTLKPGDVHPENPHAYQDVHSDEPHAVNTATRLNWLRAGVLGANDGIVSVAGLVVGVASATATRSTIATAGIAGLVAGVVSMGLGEFVSVSSQRDTERALLARERRELLDEPDDELEELIAIYESKGLSRRTATDVAIELTAHDAFTAHAEAELGIDPTNLVNPWHAIFASAVSFTVGGLVPLLAILVPTSSWRVPVTVVAVLVALTSTGVISARLGGSSRRTAVLRVVLGGAIAMAVTFGVGHLFGHVIS
jgi:VIT1/CCC1 family predicted Fe2+/Mn2+ transporter